MEEELLPRYAGRNDVHPEITGEAEQSRRAISGMGVVLVLSVIASVLGSFLALGWGLAISAGAS
jgi:hypothetical protein